MVAVPRSQELLILPGITGYRGDIGHSAVPDDQAPGLQADHARGFAGVGEAAG